MVNFWLIFAWLTMDVDSCCESSQPLGMTTDVFVITKAWCYEPSRTHWTIPYPRLTIQAKPSSRAEKISPAATGNQSQLMFVCWFGQNSVQV